MKAIAVDDEKRALLYLKKLITGIEDVTLVGSYTDPQKAIKLLNDRDDIDIVFLDIEMPIMNGIEFARMIDSVHINVVFITAYNQYAIDAFRVYALSYLLKPVEEKELKKVIEYIECKRQDEEKIIYREKNQKLQVKCFGGFDVKIVHGEVLNWRTKKAEELMAFLLNRQDKGCSKSLIIENLWSDKVYEKALNNLYTTVYYIKRTLENKGLEGMIYRRNDKYYIDLEKIKCDYIDFSYKAKKSNKYTQKEIEEIIKIYDGEYLEGRAYEWINETKAYMDNCYIKMQIILVDQYLKQEDLEKAKNTLIEVVERMPYYEEGYVKLIEILTKCEEREMCKRYTDTYRKLIGGYLEVENK